MSEDEWFSDSALAKQAVLAEKEARGEKPTFEDFCGVVQRRVPPTADECCVCCGTDARDDMGGEVIYDRRWCFICIGRDHPEPNFDGAA